jgi:hypothetical protein
MVEPKRTAKIAKCAKEGKITGPFFFGALCVLGGCFIVFDALSFLLPAPCSLLLAPCHRP